MSTYKSSVIERLWWPQVLLISTSAIIFVVISGFIGTKVLVPLIGWGDGLLPWIDHIYHLEGNFARWDSGYYLKIAESGYSVEGNERAFFPLYPFFVRFLTSIIDCSLLWSGIFVSIISFVSACLFIYRWVLIDYDHQSALWTVIWLCAFPMSFFFIACYAESLLLLLGIAAVYFARRSQFIISGLAIALAGATHPIAFLLAVPYMIEFWQQRKFVGTQLLNFGIGLFIAPLGGLSYLVLLGRWANNVNILEVYTALQGAEWDRYSAWPWVTFLDGARAALLGSGIKLDWFSRALAWQDLIYAILSLVLSIWALLSRVRLSVVFYLFGATLFLYTQHGPYGYAFWSIPRHVASLFPIYLLLAIISIRLVKLLRWFSLTASISLLGILSAWFTSGRWVA